MFRPTLLFLAIIEWLKTIAIESNTINWINKNNRMVGSVSTLLEHFHRMLIVLYQSFAAISNMIVRHSMEWQRDTYKTVASNSLKTINIQV
jgi:hypothetical protein